MSFAPPPALWRPPVAEFTDDRAQLARDTLARLHGVAARHPDAVIASSLQAEDAVLVAMNAGLARPLAIATIDTFRLPAESHDALAALEARYSLPITVIKPDRQAVADWEAAIGREAIYEGLAPRQACCALRKTAPLAKLLQGRSAWVTGQRRAQSATRTSVALEADDPQFGLMKFNPLADWSEADVWAYVRAHDVPVSALYARGYASIGCEPCTRAIRVGEDIRAGRWWWEAAATKECGLHAAPQTQLEAAAP